jgi:hypothetical protein
MGIIVEYIQVWDHLLEVQLQPEVEDIHNWRLAASGQYSTKYCLSHVRGFGNHGRHLSVVCFYGLKHINNVGPLAA